jgi:hypothetical protein
LWRVIATRLNFGTLDLLPDSLPRVYERYICDCIDANRQGIETLSFCGGLYVPQSKHYKHAMIVEDLSQGLTVPVLEDQRYGVENVKLNKVVAGRIVAVDFDECSYLGELKYMSPQNMLIIK